MTQFKQAELDAMTHEEKLFLMLDKIRAACASEGLALGRINEVRVHYTEDSVQNGVEAITANVKLSIIPTVDEGEVPFTGIIGCPNPGEAETAL